MTKFYTLNNGKAKHLSLVATAAIILLVAVLYGAFLDNPLIFDDQYFFLPGNPSKYVAEGFQLRSRWLANYSHGITFVALGEEIYWQRVGNMLLHAATGLTLYAFIRRLLIDITPKEKHKGSLNTAALVAALIFVAHPVAAYATGYLIQRTTVMATLFTLLSWHFFWRGLSRQSIYLWLSTAMFALSILSKEHAIMAPLVCCTLLILHRRSKMTKESNNTQVGIALALQLTIAILTALAAKKFIGTTYEPLAQEILESFPGKISVDYAYPLSVLTQTGLFFKYIVLWLLPNGTWMSIDMREAFIQPPIGFVSWLKLATFIAWPVLATTLLWRGSTRGVVGFALLAPWIMFMTELSTVRAQEIFVLYRSYLWMPALLLTVGVAYNHLSSRIRSAAAVIVVVFLSAFSYNVLHTFSRPLFVWNEAAALVETSDTQRSTAGAERIFHNRGIERSRIGFTSGAIEDFDRALSINPDYIAVLGDRAAARLQTGDFHGALSDFNKALETSPLIARLHAGRAQALGALGMEAESHTAHLYACALGWRQSCNIVGSAPAQEP